MSNESPVRLLPEVRRALGKAHGKTIKEHSLSYAVNVALAQALGISAPLTPREKMAKASKARWRATKRAARKAPAKKRTRKPAE